jgi:hypothetical protein
MTGVETFGWLYWLVGLLGLSIVVVTVFGGDGPDTSPTFLKRAGLTWLALVVLYGGVRLL